MRKDEYGDDGKCEVHTIPLAALTLKEYEEVLKDEDFKNGKYHLTVHTCGGCGLEIRQICLTR